MSLCVGTHLIPHPNKVSAGFSTLPLTIFSQIECSLRLSYLSRVLELEGTHRRGGCFFCQRLLWRSYCCCWWCLWVWVENLGLRNLFYWLIHLFFYLHVLEISIFQLISCSIMVVLISFSCLVGLKKMWILLCFLESSWLTPHSWWGMTMRLYHLNHL